MRHEIWNSEFDVDNFMKDEEFVEEMKEMGIDLKDDEDVYEYCRNTNAYYLEDEKANLSCFFYDKPIIQMADLGLWDGRHKAYKILCDRNNNSNLNMIFSSAIGDDQDFFVEDAELHCIDKHHDGTNLYTYRVLTVDAEEATELLNAIYYQKPVSQILLNKYTKSLADDVCSVYGW